MALLGASMGGAVALMLAAQGKEDVIACCTDCAFASLKDVLTKHRALVSAFLEASYDQFFRRYMRLVTSEVKLMLRSKAFTTILLVATSVCA